MPGPPICRQQIQSIRVGESDVQRVNLWSSRNRAHSKESPDNKEYLPRKAKWGKRSVSSTIENATIEDSLVRGAHGHDGVDDLGLTAKVEDQHEEPDDPGVRLCKSVNRPGGRVVGDALGEPVADHGGARLEEGQHAADHCLQSIAKAYNVVCLVEIYGHCATRSKKTASLAASGEMPTVRFKEVEVWFLSCVEEPQSLIPCYR